MPISNFRDDGWLPVGHHKCTWEEVEAGFSGTPSTIRAQATAKLLEFRDELRAANITGYPVLNGSYISDKLEPHDFDVLLVADPESLSRIEESPQAAQLLDAENAEAHGFSLLFVPSNSSVLPLIETIWDISKQGVPKGVLEATL